MKKILILLTSIFLIACQTNKDDFNKTVDSISVYSIKTTVHTPVSISREDIKSTPAKIIEDKKIIESILKQVATLALDNNAEPIIEDIYLRADFYAKNKTIGTILYNRFHIIIGKKQYKVDKKLLNLLTQQ